MKGIIVIIIVFCCRIFEDSDYSENVFIAHFAATTIVTNNDDTYEFK